MGIEPTTVVFTYIVHHDRYLVVSNENLDKYLRSLDLALIDIGRPPTGSVAMYNNIVQ